MQIWVDALIVHISFFALRSRVPLPRSRAQNRVEYQTHYNHIRCHGSTLVVPLRVRANDACGLHAITNLRCAAELQC